MKKRNPVAKELREDEKFRKRIIPSKRKEYERKNKKEILRQSREEDDHDV